MGAIDTSAAPQPSAVVASVPRVAACHANARHEKPLRVLWRFRFSRSLRCHIAPSLHSWLHGQLEGQLEHPYLPYRGMYRGLLSRLRHGLAAPWPAVRALLVRPPVPTSAGL